MSKVRYYSPGIEFAAALFPRFDVADAAETRAISAARQQTAVDAGLLVRPSDDHIDEIERTIPGPDGAPDIPIRIYMPVDRTSSGPGFVNFHGGGFIMGDLESDHARCLNMASQAGCVSVGVDYRLAPEHPFPAGLEDCFQALTWVADNCDDLLIDPAHIAVGGSSAGGNLSAAVALLARDRRGPEIAFQMLCYPVIDDACTTLSMQGGADCYIWNAQNCLDMWDQYLGPDRGEVSPYAAPARADTLQGLPPAYISTCEHDPLRDEAIQYALDLMHAGVSVELCNYAGTVHGFDNLIASPVSTRAVADGIAALKRALS